MAPADETIMMDSTMDNKQVKTHSTTNPHGHCHNGIKTSTRNKNRRSTATTIRHFSNASIIVMVCFGGIVLLFLILDIFRIILTFAHRHASSSSKSNYHDIHSLLAGKRTTAEITKKRIPCSFPPIYWINLDKSTSRKERMLLLFKQIGISSSAHVRVPAVTSQEAKELWKSQKLKLYPHLSLDEPGVHTNPHSKNIYLYQEAGCLLSHLTTIKKAYDDGHDMVLILEDDAVLSQLVMEELMNYISEGRAPIGWKILQLGTSNLHVASQGILLKEPFVSWQPYHWCTRAYLINRRGMKTLLEKVHDSSMIIESSSAASAITADNNNESIWNIEQYPMIVSDEVIYTLVGDAYTSTGLWIDGFMSNSTVLRDESNIEAENNILQSYGDKWDSVQQRTLIMKRRANSHLFNESSLLVLMSVHIANEETMIQNLEWIHQDSIAICQYHNVCDWEIHVVIIINGDKSFLMKRFEQRLLEFPSNIHFHITETYLEPTFSFIERFTKHMPKYDLVLLKDNYAQLNGFPWQTFLQKKDNAVIASPLRQRLNEAITYNIVNSRSKGRHQRKQRQKLIGTHDAYSWIASTKKWRQNLFTSITPIEVPILEMFFVLLDATFASDFVSTPQFEQNRGHWCQAAKDWNNSSRPGCYLVPLVSSHRDTSI